MAEGSEAEQDKTMKKILLIINCTMLAIGTIGGNLILRLYFIHGGNRVWLSSFLQTVGFPIILLPLAISYIHRRRRHTSTDTQSTNTKIVSMKPPLFFAFVVIGILVGLNTFLYACGAAQLPVSTLSLISATNLAFTAVFAFLLVRQKFTTYSVNAIVLLTLGAGVLAMHTSGDRPAGVSTKQYVKGFLMTLMASALYGLVLPLMELAYKKTNHVITYTLVLEVQFVMCLFATIFSIIGMIVNNDFKVILRESRHFGLGKTNYYVVLVGSAILWQFFMLGAIGVVFCGSSLFSGIIIAMCLPITGVFGVVFYKERFQAEKGVSLVLSLWGFISYFYGEFKQAKEIEIKDTLDTELPQALTIPNP